MIEEKEGFKKGQLVVGPDGIIYQVVAAGIKTDHGRRYYDVESRLGDMQVFSEDKLELYETI